MKNLLPKPKNQFINYHPSKMLNSVSTSVELLAPAGDFSTAIWAYKAGADAVYLGLNNFSARSSATNFTLPQLRRLKKYAINNNKKILVAINTILTTLEFPLLEEYLYSLMEIGIDGVIVQDLGVAALIHNFFPHLPLHASTQMAIHNSAGLQMAQELGFKRVVLSRELGYEFLKELRKNNPQIELEVFVHGALCYSFSGLCLASGLMLGRSGNRGECAQICRNYFTNKKLGTKYFFSCNDLQLASKIKELRDLGINALKIEGRMKSREYVYLVVSWYRALLDQVQKQDQNQDQQKEQVKLLPKKVSLTFSRRPTLGYFNNKRGEELLNPHYPGHLGVYLGTIDQVQNYFSKSKNGRWLIRINNIQSDLNKNDLLLYLQMSDEELTCSSHFNAFKIKVNKCQRRSLKSTSENWQEVDKAERGDNILIEIKDFTPAACAKIYLTKSSDLPKLSSFDEKLFPFIKRQCRVHIKIEKSNINFITKELDCALINSFPRNVDGESSFKRPLVISYSYDKNSTLYDKKNANYEQDESFPIDEHNSIKVYEDNINLLSKKFMNLLSESKDSWVEVCLDKLEVEEIELAKKMSLSTIKAAKNYLYNQLSEWYKKKLAEAHHQLEVNKKIWSDRLLENIVGPNDHWSNLINSREFTNFIRQRKNLGPQGTIFVDHSHLDSVDKLAHWGNYYFLPLNPIILDNHGPLDDYGKGNENSEWNKLEQSLEKLIEGRTDSNNSQYFLIGINNLGHLKLARKLSNYPQVRFFVDFYQYLANDYSYLLLKNLVNPLWGYQWVEAEATRKEIHKSKFKSTLFSASTAVKLSEHLTFPLVTIEDLDTLPLFISLGCFHFHQEVNLTAKSQEKLTSDSPSCSGCANGHCGGKFTYRLRNNSRHFRVEVYNCITYFFQERK